MASTETPVCDFGWKAVDFALPATDGRTYRLADIAGPRGTLLVFMCNHCPYVRAVIDRLVEDAAHLQGAGIGVAGIMPNDTVAYPQDDLAHMTDFARAHGFTFPYLIDETQEVARAYGAVCTPDFFGFNDQLALQYRGRLDASRREAAPDVPRELRQAMLMVAETGQGPEHQVPSMGCSIKWRAAA